MSLSIKLSTIALALNAALCSSAYATMDQWDSTSLPWGTSTLAQQAEWNEFAWTSSSGNTYRDATPDISGAGTLSATGTPIITSTSNIYSWQENPTSYGVSLAGSTGSFFDVYLRAATLGLAPSTTAYLNGVAATAVQTYFFQNGTQFGQVDAEHEFYYKWSNVSGASLYNFSWNDLTAHTSLDQLAVATVQLASAPAIVTSPVPEPETYAMMLAGLGLMGFVAKRRTKYTH